MESTSSVCPILESFAHLQLPLQNPYSILTIPRARRIHQSLLTSLPTALFSLVITVYHLVLAPVIFPNDNHTLSPDVLLLNGPGTCFTICIAVYLKRVSLA